MYHFFCWIGKHGLFLYLFSFVVIAFVAVVLECNLIQSDVQIRQVKEGEKARV